MTTLLAFVVLVAVGREIRPESSRAATALLDGRSVELGSLSSPATRLEMSVRNGEVRFRVIDADGKILAADLDEAALAARYPRLDLGKLHGLRMMLAEPDDER
ncbi:MAG: hypothetical protein AABZ53_14205 [Planctomycetota bacterium]